MSKGVKILVRALLILLGFGLVYAVTSSDMAKIAEMETSISRKKALLERLNGLPKKEELIRRKLEELSEAAAEEYLYQGEHSIVQAQVQRDIYQAAKAAGIQIGTIRSLGNARQSGLIVRSSVQLSWSGNYDKLLRFLQQLEQWKPFLQVRKLSLKVVRPSTSSEAAVISIIMEISGYRNGKGRDDI